MKWYGEQAKAHVKNRAGQRIERAARGLRDFIRERLSTPLAATGYKAVHRGPSKAERARRAELKAVTYGGREYAAKSKETGGG